VSIKEYFMMSQRQLFQHCLMSTAVCSSVTGGYNSRKLLACRDDETFFSPLDQWCQSFARTLWLFQDHKTAATCCSLPRHMHYSATMFL